MFKKVFPYAILALFFFLLIYMLYQMDTSTITTDFRENLREEGGNLVEVTALTSIFFKYYTTFAIGFIFVIIGIYCYVQKPKSIVAINFFYLMVVSGAAIAFSIPSSLGLTLGREVESLSVSFSPYFLMRFFEYFPSSTKPNFFHKIKYITLSIAIAISTISVASSLLSWSVFSYFIRLGLIFNLSLSIISCIFIISIHLKSNSLWIKNQLYILIGSLILSFGPVLLLSLIPDGVFQLSSIPYSYSICSIIIFPISLAYLLTKQEVIDFSVVIKKYAYKLVSIFLTLIFMNLVLSFFITLTLIQAIQYTIFILTSLFIFDILQKMAEPIKMKKWRNKAQEIQKEKKYIFQQMLQKKHLSSCAKHIIDLIHKALDINGVCIIWNQINPIVLHHSGIFHDNKISAEIVQQLVRQPLTDTKMFRKEPYFIFPLHSGKETLGWIIVGQKKNLTMMDKKELLLLEHIQEDASDLFSNARMLHQIEKKLVKAQETMALYDHFNTDLLNVLEDEKKKLSIFLHDEVLQNCILLSNKLQLLNHKQTNPLQIRTEMETLLKNSIYEIREMCNDLHPVIVEDLGLETGLNALRKKLQAIYSVIIDIHYEISLKIIPTNLAIQIFRMIKELIHNSIKHSDSPHIYVSVKESDELLTIIVEDYGKGFVISNENGNLFDQGHIGLISIQKRVNQLNGFLDIRSELNIGTSVTITVPMEWSELIENQSFAGR